MRRSGDGKADGAGERRALAVRADTGDVADAAVGAAVDAATEAGVDADIGKEETEEVMTGTF